MKKLLTISIAFLFVTQGFIASAQSSSEPSNDEEISSPDETTDRGNFVLSAGGGVSVPFDAKMFGTADVEMDDGPAATLTLNYFFEDLEYLYVGLDFTYFSTEINRIASTPFPSNRINAYNGLVSIGVALPVGDIMLLTVGGGIGVGIFDTTYSSGGFLSENDEVGVYKLEIGAQFALSEAWGLGIGYKFMGTTNDIEIARNGIDLEDFQTNVFTAAVTFRF